MLEGKLKIELTDVKTGKKKTHEQHNLVTDNIQFMLNAVSPSLVFPLYSNAMGCLALFDSEITGVSGNHFVGLPNNAKYRGFADRNVNISDQDSGSLNTAECSQTENSFTNVWDFSTSQLNGTIGSIALMRSYPFSEKGQSPSTGRNVGTQYLDYYIKIPGGGYTRKFPGAFYQPVYYDPNTNFVYIVQYVTTDEGSGNTQGVLFGRVQYTMNYGVIENAYSLSHIEVLKVCSPSYTEPDPDYITNTYNCTDAKGISSDTVSVSVTSGNQLCWFGSRDGYAYYVTTGDVYENDEVVGSQLCWLKFRVYDGSFDFVEGKYLNLSNEDLSHGLFENSPHRYLTSYSSSTYHYTVSHSIVTAVLCDDKFFIYCGKAPNSRMAYTYNGYYIIDLNNLTDIAFYSLSISTSSTPASSVEGYQIPGMTVFPDGIVSIESVGTGDDATQKYTLYKDGTYITRHAFPGPTAASNTLNNVSFIPFNCPIDFTNYAFAGTNSVDLRFFVGNYLLNTICNLSQPVQKTSAQTMKITYTISSYKPMFFSTQPRSSVAEPNDQLILTVAVAEGSGSYSYQWQQSTNNINWTDCTEATANSASLELTVGNTTTHYRCVATDSLGQSITSLTATITVET